MDHLSLEQLNAIVKKTLSKELEPSYWVIAEIGEMRVNQSGHCYFELVQKQDDSLLAKSRANMWSYTYRNLSTWFEGITGQPLQNGLQILINVSVEYHEIYGLSLNIKDIEPNFTLGERARKKQEVLNQLIDDGVFTMNKDLSLPIVPQRIAIISSPTAAGYEDFVDQLTKNEYGYHFSLSLFKALMQGDEAIPSIVDALHKIDSASTKFDVVVLIRGGGSKVDLDCFDSYHLTAHIAQFPLPVITGIGHERDESIADMVAHTSLKTPTAVSEFLITGLRAFEDRVDYVGGKILDFVQKTTQDQDSYLNKLQDELRHQAAAIINSHEGSIDLLVTKLRAVAQWPIHQNSQVIASLTAQLNLLRPNQVLSRGYSLTHLNGEILKDDTGVSAGDKLTTTLFKGEISSIVEK